MDDPLIALVSELRELKVDNASASFTKMAANMGKILIPTLSSIVKSFLKHKGLDINILKDSIDAAKDVGLSCLDEYAEAKAAIEDFKKNLEEYIAGSTEGKPVVFFIDDIKNTVLDTYRAATSLDLLGYGIESTIATLIVNCNNPWRGDVVDAFFVGADTDKEGVKDYPFNVKKLNKGRLNEELNWVATYSREKLHMGLSFTTNRIDLLNPLISKEKNSHWYA